MSGPLRVAVAGLGTVGAEVVRLLRAEASLIAQRCGRDIRVTAVSARDRTRDRGVDLSDIAWFTDAAEMANAAPCDVVVELIGGADGVAKGVCEAAVDAGRAVVTANKALLAIHGPALAVRAEERAVPLAYEAAVAGGIPVVKALREGLAGNRIRSLFGILNGTCNYILTGMRETGREFADVLAEAQALGYAEADPSFDIDGVDTAHKLAILAAVAFNAQVDFQSVHVEGIRHVSAQDIAYAEELGLRIKLLGIAHQRDGGVELRVHPCMIDKDSPMASVGGAFNAVELQGDHVGPVMLYGMGAGAGPTASAVIGDLCDLARGNAANTYGAAIDRLTPLTPVAMGSRRGAYYLRLMVIDRPGVIADITAVMRDHRISVESFLQRGRAPDDAVPLVITTHETAESAIMDAMQTIDRLDSVLEPPRLIRIEVL